MENFIFRALILRANYLAICPKWLLLLPAKLSIGQFNPIMSIFPCFLTFLLQHRSQFSTFIKYSLNIFKNFLNSLEIPVFSKSSTDLHQVFRNDKGTNQVYLIQLWLKNYSKSLKLNTEDMGQTELGAQFRALVSLVLEQTRVLLLLLL